VSKERLQPNWSDMPIVTKEYAERHPVDESREARIVVPDQETIERLDQQMRNPKCCGMCKSFRLRQGQEQIQSERVFERAIVEFDWDPSWIGDPRMYGTCDQWEGHSCSFYAPTKIPLKFLDSSVSYESQDSPRDCPAFKYRGKGVLSSAVHYIGKRQNYEE
jgi:hypothetical protein